MTVIQKSIGRLPVNLGDYDSSRAYGKKNRVNLYGCEWESKVDNNTHAPATLVGGLVTPDTTHWKLNAGVPGNYGLDSEVAEIQEVLPTKADKSDTYTKEEVNSLITTPDQEFVSVTATISTTSITDVLPATGAPDTIYRVGNWDGAQYDTSCYAEYAWKTTGTDQGEYVLLDVKSVGIDDEPTAGSDNLAKSGGIHKELSTLPNDSLMFDFQKVITVSRMWDIEKPFNIKAGDKLVIVVDKQSFTETQTGGFAVIYFRDSDSNVLCDVTINASSGDREYVVYEAPSDLTISYYGCSKSNCTFSLLCNFRAMHSADIFVNSLNISQNKTDIEGLESEVGVNYFDNYTVGYLGSGGVKNSTPALGIVTNYVPVSEGDSVAYYGGWGDNETIGMLWGYDANKANAVKLIPALDIVKRSITIPSGVSYIRAWSANNKPHELYKESVMERILSIEEKTDGARVTTITATRNAANYNSIRELLASITYASEMDQYIILVPEGEWFECDLNGKNYVKIVGADRDKTIIYCDGTSDNLTPSDYSISAYANMKLSEISSIYKHCIMQRWDVAMENLTVRVNDVKYNFHVGASDRTTNYHNASFKNVNFIAENVNCVVGIGAENYTCVFDGCLFKNYGRLAGGIFCHNHPNVQKPVNVTVMNSIFEGCCLGNIAECGSGCDDNITYINCYSDRPDLQYFVDPSLQWINPSTGSRETDATKYPYSFKVNAIGTNIKKMYDRPIDSLHRTRPQTPLYVKTSHYITLDATGLSVGSVVRGIFDIETAFHAIADGPILGVVEYIISGIAFIAKDSAVLEYGDYTSTGSTGSKAYEDANGKITNAVTSKEIGYFGQDFFSIFKEVILNK